MTEKPQKTVTTAGTRQRLVFPLAVTIAAVLPLAFGVGAVRLKASASPAVAIPRAIEIDQNSEESQPISRPTDRRLGDQQLLERRYEVALQYYQSLGSADHNRMPPELLYRIALCQEGLGLWNEALGSLRIVSNTTDNPALKAAGIFGQARLWIRLDEPGRAASIFRFLALHSELQNALPRNLSREIGFLIPLALAQEAASQTRRPGKSYPVPGSELFNLPLETTLSWADEPLRNAPSEVDAASTSDSLSIRLKRKSVEPTDVLTIEERTVDVDCHLQPLRLIVERLADECGWNLDWSSLSDDPSLDRIVSITAEDQPVCLLLTIICSDVQSRWTVKDDQLTIALINPGESHSQRMIAQTLVSLTNWFPHHRLADHARFALAEIAQSEGHFADAATLFSSLSGRSSSPLAICAAYNSAHIYYKRGDFVSACGQLGHIVDGAPESEWHSEAMILLGRLLLDRGEIQAAIFQFRRAAEPNNLVDIQARAAVLLGMSYLVQEKPQEAAEAVFVHKAQFEDPAVRNAAALVTAFARWQSVKGEMQEREAAYLYRSLMAMKSDSEWLGQTGQLLIGRVLLELGFDDHMAEHYTQMLASNATENIRCEIMCSLGDYEWANGRLKPAKELWEKVCAGTFNRWTNRTRLRLANVALTEGRFTDCLEICELVQPGEGIVLADIQKLMGRAFEQLGEFALAARCFAGQYPTQ